MNNLLSSAEAAQRLNLSKKVLLNLVKDNRISAVKVSEKTYNFSLEAIEDFIKNSSTKVAPPSPTTIQEVFASKDYRIHCLSKLLDTLHVSSQRLFKIGRLNEAFRTFELNVRNINNLIQGLEGFKHQPIVLSEINGMMKDEFFRIANEIEAATGKPCIIVISGTSGQGITQQKDGKIIIQALNANNVRKLYAELKDNNFQHTNEVTKDKQQFRKSENLRSVRRKKVHTVLD